MKLAACSLGALAVVTFAGSPAHAQGQLFVVDQAGGPGSDFTTLQQAIDAAQDGDTLLVKSGGAPSELTIL